MIEGKTLPDPIFIRNILTLRYNPEKPTFEKKLGLRDFEKIDYQVDIPEKIESFLRNEVKLRAGKADNIAIPIGSGIDSAIILALVKQVFPKKNIFGISLGFCDSQDETNDAKRICKALDTEFHVLSIEDVLQDLPRQIRIVGEPRWNLWYYYVLEHANKLGADIMLTGDGGDELFAGYVFRYSKYLSLIKDAHEPPISFPKQEAKWVTKAWCYLQCHSRDWVPDQDQIFGANLSGIFDWYSILRYFKPYFENRTDQDLNQVFLADYNGKLVYDWIPTNTRLSEYFRIQTLCPFLSDSITDFAPHIPTERKYDAETQEGKLILREILRRHGILHLVAKNKLGFGMDLVNLWKKHGKRIVDKYLDRAIVCQRQIINKAWLNRTMDSTKKNQDPRYINKMLQLLSLEIWYRITIKKETMYKIHLD